jgi:fermentation-respiration switch protein FrsA (DUF1100 family)
MNKVKKRILIVVTSLIILLIGMFIGFSYFIGDQIVASSTQLVTNEKTRNIHDLVWKDYGFNYESFSQTYKIENINLTSSFDGHAIPVDFIYSNDKNSNIVIMAHGLGGNRQTNYPRAEFFLKNGYNVITYDQRSSGENVAEKTTFGYWEKYDIIDCIKYAKDFAKDKKIGVWGESFGGATAVQAVAFENVQEDIAFLALDCPVSNMEWMISDQMKSMEIGIPIEYMMWCGNIINSFRLGFSYNEADAAKEAHKIRIPTLVINSEIDKVTPYFMGKDIYDNLASTKKSLWTVKDSKHVGMWNDYNEEYCSKLLELMQNP